MTPRYPGAFWRPTGDWGPLTGPVDSFTYHEVVSRAEKSIFGYNQSSKVCHGYNGRYGYMEQYVDLDRLVYGVKDGNSHRATWESFDGLLISNANGQYTETGMGGEYGTDANNGRWDAGQMERWADLMAWGNIALGIPLRIMANSSRSEVGHAPHRWGIDPWRSQMGGSESWTQHDGKPCPGNLRVEQLPLCIPRAIQIRDAVLAGTVTWLPPGDVDLSTALKRGTVITPPAPPEDWSEMATEAQIRKIFREEIAAALTIGDDRSVDEKIKNPKTGVRQSLGSRILGIQGTVSSIARKLGV